MLYSHLFYTHAFLETVCKCREEFNSRKHVSRFSSDTNTIHGENSSEIGFLINFNFRFQLKITLLVLSM